MGRRISKVLEAAALIVMLLLLSQNGRNTADADTLITGSVFCDQCRDGRKSNIDYPLFGAKVRVECSGTNGKMITYEDGTTNWFGAYRIKFWGSPDISRCRVRFLSGPAACPDTTETVKDLKLFFEMFDTVIYTVDPILAQPQLSKVFCHTSASPLGSPTPSILPPAFRRHGEVIPAPSPSPSPSLLVSSPYPSPSPMASPLKVKPSACPHRKWAMIKNKCHWKMVTPETTVAMAFGVAAAERYGTNITLWQSLAGRGDIYQTVLREATTALLNSYNSQAFFYPTEAVIEFMDKAMAGPPHQALYIALIFRRANTGEPNYGNARCTFKTCLPKST